VRIGTNAVTAEATLVEIERLIRRDPASRGLISSESTREPLCPGHLAHAAKHLAQHGRRAIIVTGFFIPGATPPAAETDGPPGAALLAAALIHVGLTVQIITDEPCRSAVESAAIEMGLSPSQVHTISALTDDPDEWCANLLPENSPTEPLTHLIAIERVGPSHTIESVRDQLFHNATTAPELLNEFQQLVPVSAQNRCHNMRGDCIDAHTAPLHRLFELAAQRPALRTIGIGDGGNEIGMGSIPWSELHRRLNGTVSHIPCRITTDWTLIAGVSNWGGQALAAATLLLANKTENARAWTTQQQQQALERLVKNGPAVDGITRLPEPTVDGLPFLTYIQPWEGMRRLLGFDDA
jgi:hypothetical protein